MKIAADLEKADKQASQQKARAYPSGVRRK